MRFCMVTTFYPPFNFGGDGVFIQQLASQLAARGHHVEVVHCTDSYRILGGKKPPAEDAGHPGVTVHRLHSPYGFLSPLATQQTGLPFFKSARLDSIMSEGFDVIHFHNISLVGGPGILRYGKGVKLCSLHDYWLLCPTHMLFKYNRKLCHERRCFACTLAHGRPPQLWRYTRAIEKFADLVDSFIAPSAFIKQKYLETGLRAPIVELPYFTARWRQGPLHEYRPEGGEPYFLVVGRLEKVKGIQTLIPVFQRYRKARLVIAGTGRFERRLRRMARGSDNICFLGYQSGEALRAWYAQAAAVIVPSIWYEVFGQVIIEAFSQKTPVIVRGCGGMPEIVQQSGGGFVYETERELLEAMAALLEDASCRRTAGMRGFEAFLKRWTAGVHLQGYLELIESLQLEPKRHDRRAAAASRQQRASEP